MLTAARDADVELLTRERDEVQQASLRAEEEPDEARAAHREMVEERNGIRAERYEARAAGETVVGELDAVRDERDEARCQLTIAVTHNEELTQGVTEALEVIVELALDEEALRERSEQVLETGKDTAQARARVGVRVGWLHGEMAQREVRMGEFHCDRQAVEMRARFAARCVMRGATLDAVEEMERAAAELDGVMGDIVGGRNVAGLTENGGSEEYEENMPFQAPQSPLQIFAHEQN